MAVRDVLPVQPSASVSINLGVNPNPNRMLFPQWEWVMCVVAYQAVETGTLHNSTR